MTYRNGNAGALACDMRDGCAEPVTMIDSAGFVYCEADGMVRQSYEPCRHLRPWEKRRLERGVPLARY